MNLKNGTVRVIAVRAESLVLDRRGEILSARCYCATGFPVIFDDIEHMQSTMSLCSTDPEQWIPVAATIRLSSHELVPITTTPPAELERGKPES